MNNNFKKILEKITTIKLGVCFASLISIIFIISAIFISMFIASNTKEVAGEYATAQKLTNTAINMAIFKTVAKDYDSGIRISKNSISKNIIEPLQQAGIIDNVEIRENETNKLLYEYKYNVDKDKTSKNETKPDKYSEYSKDFGDYSIIIYAYKEIYQRNALDSMVRNIHKYIANVLLIIIVIGIITGVYMSEIVSHSLEKLSKAAKKMASGNFDIKIPRTHYYEINDLISSYNEMGEQLNDLYSSLENKVQERTLALEEANNKLKETQAMMVHSEKMRSLGELVAGIAHEINNPVNFIHGNIMILQNYSDDLFKVIDLYDKYSDKLTSEEKSEIDELKKDIDLDFMRDDIKDLIKSCIEGTQRTKNIVLDLKNFSRMEEMVLTQFDIPKEIDTTLNILNNKYKNRITVVKNYSPDVPKIEAYGGQLNQVFMNILDNAQDAIEDEGTVTINVLPDENDKSKVKIEFIDTGVGIAKENIKKVFEPFFTTKVVGKGTGLGMSISYRVIKDHNGTIEIDSEIGKGTKFTIRLPINHETKNTEADGNGVINAAG